MRAPVKLCFYNVADDPRVKLAAMQSAAMLANPNELFSVPVEEQVRRAFAIADELIKQGGEGIEQPAYYSSRSTPTPRKET